MAAHKSDPSNHDAKYNPPRPSALARVMREFEDLVNIFEEALLHSDHHSALLLCLSDDEARRREKLRQEARRLAIDELSTKYTRKSIRTSLCAAESMGKLAEERLYSAADVVDAPDASLDRIRNGYFRLYSSQLFDLLGQPTDLRFGTLRFHTSHPDPYSARDGDTSLRTAVELALNSSFYIADSAETLPYHHFYLPGSPSLQNHGLLSRKWDDAGAFPDYDSWLLFTFLGSGYLKIEIPIEMCADIYGGPLRGRQDEEVLFWGVFVEDELLP
ncbi:hypothetical protein CC78DRAFT_537271 [Lojkania enalia]|uniref:Uncharacterized protein n=1 Tax=Lojkania enalia TaxID=147567 RepID=A0A9P4K4B9_9PLEO|nr:hypothetical protein CC78DRAFT_537271 [Didymosphaeria enalia]